MKTTLMATAAAVLALMGTFDPAEAGTKTLLEASQHLVASSPADGLSHRCGNHVCLVEANTGGKDVTVMLSSGEDKENDRDSYRTDHPVYFVTKAAPNIPSLELSLKLVSHYVADTYSADAVTKVSAAVNGVSTASDHQYREVIEPGTALHLSITNDGLFYVIQPE